MYSSRNRFPQITRFAGSQAYWQLLTSVSDRNLYTRRSIGTRSRTSRTGYSTAKGEIKHEGVLVCGARIGRDPAIICKRPPSTVNEGVHVPRRPILGELDDHRGRPRSDVGGRAADKNQRRKSVAANQRHQEATVSDRLHTRAF